jgi:hypothetical protein
MTRRSLIFAAAALCALVVTAGVILGAVVNQDDTTETDAFGQSTGLDESKGWLGVTVTANLSGLRIVTIDSSGPSSQAGLHVNDVIRSVDGQIVRATADLKAAVEPKKPGSRVNVTFERANRELQANVTLSAGPVNAQLEAPQASGVSPPAAQLMPSAQAWPSTTFVYPVLTNQMRSGLTLLPITAELKQNFELDRDYGLVIVNVAPQSYGARAGFEPGDILLAMGSTTVSVDRTTISSEGLARAFDNLQPDQATNFRVLRDGAETTIPLTLPARLELPSFSGAPPELRLMLENMVDSGLLTSDQARNMLGSGQNQSVRVGRVKDADSSRLTLVFGARNDDLNILVTPSTQFQRGLVSIAPSELLNGEVVLVMSIDGGRSALAVYSYGV